MLSHQDNETLVRVGARHADGIAVPAVLDSVSLLEGPGRRRPAEARDAARRGPGRVPRFAGARRPVANACAHRGAPMMFGRNEDCGLRCVYHGWKYRRDRRGDGYAGRAGQEPAARTRSRSRPIPAGSATASSGPTWARKRPNCRRCRMSSGIWFPAENVHRFDARAGMQLAAGAGRRNRFRACADPAQPDRFQGPGQRVAGQARPAADLRMHAPGFRHEHRGEAPARTTRSSIGA